VLKFISLKAEASLCLCDYSLERALGI